MPVIIRSLCKGLPKKHCSNKLLPPELDTNDEWIVSHTGIKARYLSDDEETPVVLGTHACFQVLKESGIDASKIELLICTTTTPAYNGFPSTACVIQKETGCINATCFDISAACSGFIYALNIAKSLMETNRLKYALICSSEVLSKICDWSDRTTCILFGDAAGAVLLEKTETQQNQIDNKGIGSFITGSDGTGEKALFLGKDGFIKMDGHTVYDFAVGIMTKIIKKIMERECLDFDDVDYFICHQANKRILQAAAKRLGFGFEKFICTMDEYGNTSSASIPITMADMKKNGMLKEGKVAVLAAFGAGLTWGGTVIRF